MLNPTLIIGHTSGIGEDIHLNIPSDGISKSKGFDIDNREHVRSFDYSSYQHIILNSYGNFTSQLSTLYDIVESKSFNVNTLIVVISSRNALVKTSKTLEKSKYNIEKNGLNVAARHLNELGYNISTVCPGYVDTYYNEGKNVPKLKRSSITKTLNYILLNFDDGILVENIVLNKV